MILEEQRYGRNKDTIVNKTYINSGEYRRKFDNATDFPIINKVLYDCAKKSLEHRSGTVFEDMYWIDYNSGKIILSVTDSNLEHGIAYTKKIKDIIENKNNIITIHTHPSSMPPSVFDFNSCVENDYIMGFVACHNGILFRYSSKQYISKQLYDLYIGEYITKGLNEFNAQINTIEELKKNYLIKCEEVKTYA